MKFKQLSCAFLLYLRTFVSSIGDNQSSTNYNNTNNNSTLKSNVNVINDGKNLTISISISGELNFNNNKHPVYIDSNSNTHNNTHNLLKLNKFISNKPDTNIDYTTIFNQTNTNDNQLLTTDEWDSLYIINHKQYDSSNTMSKYVKVLKEVIEERNEYSIQKLPWIYIIIESFILFIFINITILYVTYTIRTYPPTLVDTTIQPIDNKITHNNLQSSHNVDYIYNYIKRDLSDDVEQVSNLFTNNRTISPVRKEGKYQYLVNTHTTCSKGGKNISDNIDNEYTYSNSNSREHSSKGIAMLPFTLTPPVTPPATFPTPNGCMLEELIVIEERHTLALEQYRMMIEDLISHALRQKWIDQEYFSFHRKLAPSLPRLLTPTDAPGGPGPVPVLQEDSDRFPVPVELVELERLRKDPLRFLSLINGSSTGGDGNTASVTTPALPVTSSSQISPTAHDKIHAFSVPILHLPTLPEDPLSDKTPHLSLSSSHYLVHPLLPPSPLVQGGEGGTTDSEDDDHILNEYKIHIKQAQTENNLLLQRCHTLEQTLKLTQSQHLTVLNDTQQRLLHMEHLKSETEEEKNILEQSILIIQNEITSANQTINELITQMNNESVLTLDALGQAESRQERLITQYQSIICDLQAQLATATSTPQPSSSSQIIQISNKLERYMAVSERVTGEMKEYMNRCRDIHTQVDGLVTARSAIYDECTVTQQKLVQAESSFEQLQQLHSQKGLYTSRTNATMTSASPGTAPAPSSVPVKPTAAEGTSVPLAASASNAKGMGKQVYSASIAEAAVEIVDDDDVTVASTRILERLSLELSQIQAASRHTASVPRLPPSSPSVAAPTAALAVVVDAATTQPAKTFVGRVPDGRSPYFASKAPRDDMSIVSNISMSSARQLPSFIPRPNLGPPTRPPFSSSSAMSKAASSQASAAGSVDSKTSVNRRALGMLKVLDDDLWVPRGTAVKRTPPPARTTSTGSTAVKPTPAIPKGVESGPGKKKSTTNSSQ